MGSRCAASRKLKCDWPRSNRLKAHGVDNRTIDPAKITVPILGPQPSGRREVPQPRVWRQINSSHRPLPRRNPAGVRYRWHAALAGWVSLFDMQDCTRFQSLPWQSGHRAAEGPVAHWGQMSRGLIKKLSLRPRRSAHNPVASVCGPRWTSDRTVSRAAGFVC